MSNSNVFQSLEDFETRLSQGSQQLFSDAILVATLAEKFGLTSFKPFVINAALECKDTVVIQPTGFSISSSTSELVGHYRGS